MGPEVASPDVEVPPPLLRTSIPRCGQDTRLVPGKGPQTPPTALQSRRRYEGRGETGLRSKGRY